MNKIRFSFAIFALLSASTFLVAQTDLMDDVDAVKENSDEDLYAPDDEEAGQAPKAPAPGTTNKAPTQPAAPSTSSSLEDLPVSGDSNRPEEALTGTEGGPAELSAIRIYSLNDRTRF